MQRLHFVKMHGAGNDFVLVDNRSLCFPRDRKDFLAAFANRPTGIGCEGVILVEPSKTADFKMRFFNPDGSEADLCGNGARCVAAFAREIGAARQDEMCFETAAGTLRAEIVSSNQVRVAMPAPRDFRADFVVAGVPHRLVRVDDLAAVDVSRLGREIRYAREYAPQGTNVDFVRYDAPHRVAIRTYERGVEAESGACGTGSVAAAVIGVKDYGLKFPVTVRTLHGYELVIEGRFEKGTFKDLSLTGPVCRVFEGDFVF